MIRFGIIGTNWISEEFIKAALKHDDFVLTAVYSRTEEKVQSFAVKHNIQFMFTDIVAFANSSEFDAVYIASPNSLHMEQALLLMDNGKHVLCEKPLASNVQEVDLMFETARRNQVLLMEAMKSTLMPNFQAIKENLHKIGKVRRYFSSYCQYSSRYDEYLKGNILNAFRPEFSNGALMDLGVYCIYPLVILFGQPKLIKANGHILDTGVDGQGSLLLGYEDMDAVIQFSKISNSYANTELHGEKGTMIIDKISSPTQVEILYRGGEREELTKPQNNESMYYEVEEFIHLIQSGANESKVNSQENSRRTMEIMDEARKQIGVVYPADSI